jgi:hypothetical protein
MRAVADHCDARTIRLALAAGLILSGALLAGAAGIGDASDPVVEDRSSVPAAAGGETVIAKFAGTKFAKLASAKFAKAKTEAGLQFAEPTSVSRLLSMALAPVTNIAPRSAEPNLEGLSEIPQELIWNRPPDKEEKAEPKTFAAFSKAREELPWDAVEPVPFSPLAPARQAAHASGAKVATAAVEAPVELAGAEVGKWVKAKVTEIKGADRSRPLYHFELWLEPPPELKRRLVGVAYEFNTPAVRPQSQASSDQTSGFRISAGGLACADEIALTLRFDDGHAEKVVVDGCKLLS